MRISDWSSDVCSSDLVRHQQAKGKRAWPCSRRQAGRRSWGRGGICAAGPARPHGIPHPAAPSPGTAQMSPGKILVVDDDAAIRTVVSEALKQAGHEVRAVPDLASMRLALAEGYGEVLVTDVMLPDGNGLDVVPEIISSYPNLPVIVQIGRAHV